MKIGIDARSLEEREKTGVARYLGNLLRQFCLIAPDNDYVLFYKTRVVKEGYLIGKCFKHHLVDMGAWPKKKVIWEQVSLPGQLAGIDVLFSPSYMTPRYASVPTVVTIHDITYEVNRQWFSPKERLKMRTLTKMAAKSAKHIIAVSEATRRDVMEHYGVEGNRITVVHEAADPAFKVIIDDAKLDECRSRFGLEAGFIMYVGSIFARRNVPALISAFRLLKDKGLKQKLLLIGENRSYPDIDIRSVIENNGVGQDVVWMDYVEEEDLIRLYNAADLFVYPSSYEGFGLPVIEAMACRAPVVTAAGSSLGEVAGEAAVLVKDPKDTVQLAEAMESVLSDETLAARLREKGPRRAGQFSWEAAAIDTLEILRKAAENN